MRYAYEGLRELGTVEMKNPGRIGWEYFHAAIDNCCRLASTEVFPDEVALTLPASSRTTCRRYTARDIVLAPILTDNDGVYRLVPLKEAALQRGNCPRYTKPSRPSTSGKVE